MARAADQGDPGIQVLAQSGAAAAATDQPKKTRDRHASRPPLRPVRRQLQRPEPRREHGPGPDLRAPLDPAGRPSLRRDPLGDPDREHRQRVGQARLRAEGRRGPRVLEPARDERRRQQVLPRPPRHDGARDERPPAHRPGRQHDQRVGRDPALLRDRRGPPRVPGRADPPARPPEDGLQLAGLVQRRDRGRSRSARPASSTRSRTRCRASWTWPRPRRCCSSSARAPAATCRRSGRAGRRCRAAAPPAARSAS